MKQHLHENGFTLLEILIGVTISAVMIVGLNSAMATLNRGFDQARGTIQRQDAIATGLAVLSADVSRILRAVDNPERPSTFVFAGTPATMVYLLEERPANNKAGVYWIRLSIQPDGNSTNLIRERAPFQPGSREPQSGWSDAVSLMSLAATFRFSYRAPRSGRRDWSDTWENLNQMPQQIRLEIIDTATGRNRIPPFVQTLKIGAEVDCGSANSAGCTLQSTGLLNGTTAQ